LSQNAWERCGSTRKLEGRIISFIDQPGVIKKFFNTLVLWEESHAPPERDPPIKEITFDPSYSPLI
jgi:hypothetical protein